MDAGAVMAARWIRESVSCTDERICMDTVAEHFAVRWVTAELPYAIHAMSAPDERIVVIASRLRNAARRFYLCHEIVECLNPVTIIHGSMYNEVSGHVLVPPWLIEQVATTCSSEWEIARRFDAPLAVVRYQMQFMARRG